jgi:hypothetical protein
MKFCLFIFMVIMSFSTSANEIPGEYAAVTESNLSLELNLRKDSTATFIVFIHAEEEGDEEFRESTEGLWKLKDDKILITYPNGVKTIFQIIDCLSYNEFGARGCSFGLKLIDGTIEKSDDLYRYGFWRVEALEKVEY